MILLTDDEIDAAWARSPQNNLRDYAKEIEAAVIRKLATVSVEPCAWEVETEQQDGTRAKWVSTDRKRHREFCDFGEPRQLYSQEAIAAARVQALEEAASVVDVPEGCEARDIRGGQEGMEMLLELAESIRALIGKPDEFHSNHKTD